MHVVKKRSIKKIHIICYKLVFCSVRCCNNEEGRTRRFADFLCCQCYEQLLGFRVTWYMACNMELHFNTGQIVLLRKNFMPVQLLQIPLSFLFGIFTDFGMYCVSFITVPNYAVRIILVLVGTLTLGFGISLSVVANVIMNSGEAFVKAVSDRTGIKFGNVKISFDICCVLASVILSLILFSGTVVGTREGTVLTALLTGIVVNFFVKRIEKPLNSALSD